MARTRGQESSLISAVRLARRRAWRLALTGGLAHAGEMTPADPVPGQPVTLSMSVNASTPLDHVAVYYTSDGSEPHGFLGNARSGMVAAAQCGAETLDPTTGMRVRPWCATIPGQAEGTFVRYRVEGWNAHGQRRHWLAGATPERPAGEVFGYVVDVARPPTWLDDAVFYAVLVDRFGFASGDDPASVLPSGFAGGTLAGVRARLDALGELGVTCLWLLPPTESATFDGLLPTSYFTVASRYGGNAALRELIDAAHERGMRVIVSLPLFQVAPEHPLSRRAVEHPLHPIARWFLPTEVGTPPTLNTDHPDVARYLLDVATFWLGDMGLDGLHIPDAEVPPLVFWAAFQRAVKAAFPRALTLGSVACSVAEACQYAGRLDAVFDCPLALALRRVFASREAPLREVLVTLGASASHPRPGARVTFLDFLDLARFAWLGEGSLERVALAATCQMTLEGTPALFYGTEVGLAQERDCASTSPGAACAEACAPMPWHALDTPAPTPQRALREYFGRLLALRVGHPALRHGQRLPLPTQVLAGPADAADQVGAYARWTDAEYLVVALNNAEETVSLRLPLAATLRSIGAQVDDSTPFDIHLATTPIATPHLRAGALELTLPPLSAVILGQG